MVHTRCQFLVLISSPERHGSLAYVGVNSCRMSWCYCAGRVPSFRIYLSSVMSPTVKAKNNSNHWKLGESCVFFSQREPGSVPFSTIYSCSPSGPCTFQKLMFVRFSLLMLLSVALVHRGLIHCHTLAAWRTGCCCE